MQYGREIAVGKAYDVVVCGGGPAGCAAALAARREGLSTILLEDQAQLGGMATSGHVAHWLGGRSQAGEWVVGGLFRGLAEEAARLGFGLLPRLSEARLYQPHAWLPWFVHGIPLDPFRTASLLDRKMVEAGVDLRLECRVLDGLVEAGRISHVVVGHKAGLQAIPATAVIDATGDGDLAAFSGCSLQVGRESDGLMTPASLIFHLDRVDHRELGDFIETNHCPKFYQKIEQLRAAGKWPFETDIFISVQLPRPDAVMINMVRMSGVDGLDPVSRTNAMIRGRSEAIEMLKIFREHFPGFAEADLKSIASLPGIRETRRLKGEFQLSIKEVLAGTDFADTIGFSMYGWDLLDPVDANRQPLVDFTTGRYVSRIQSPASTPIPYRIMVPRPVGNLLCPGRAVSVERDLLGPLRVMAPCMAMGEAAGVAASQVVNHGLAFREVDTAALKTRLRAVGAIVDQEALPEIAPRLDP